MVFLVRPSKTFLFNILGRHLKCMEGRVGIDVGCAEFKNRQLFKTEYYYGLDIDIEQIRRGLRRFPSATTYGIVADVRDLTALSADSADVVVSTNTLYVLTEKEREHAVEALSVLTAPQGALVVEIHCDEAFDRICTMLRGIFTSVSVIYWRNVFSRTYESIFERDGYLGSHPIAGTRLFRFIAWVISCSEYLTLGIRSHRKRVLIMCAHKKGNRAKRSFILDHLPLVDGRIFLADVTRMSSISGGEK